MRSLLRHLCLLCLLSPAAATALDNQLVDHPSPYLAMHGEDPVPWQDWGDAALALARAEDRIIYISSGYFSCHWCHVMQRESYADPAVAALLEEHFVPVKLDRELEPALDKHLIDFTERTQGRAGWPLNVFLTPEGYPLVGITYLPKAQFIRVLERVVSVWQQEREQTRQLARQMLLDASAEVDLSGMAPKVPGEEIRRLLIRDALAFGDDMAGGFGRQNKFPMAPQLLVLLEIQASHPQPELDEFLRLTLDQMAAQGLRDHLAGGFFRYTVDPGWQVPHYEKMLYTQALLTMAYARAAEVLDQPGYLEVARDTLAFVLAEMRATEGGYIASLSAVDAEGEEGGGYVWHEDRLRELFTGSDLEVARRYWNLQGTPATEGGFLPTRGASVDELATALEIDPKALVNQISRLRQSLLEARSGHRIPRDGKVLAAWNGLLLAAVAATVESLPDTGLEQVGAGLARYLREVMMQNGELSRARAAGQALGQAGIEDYAFVAWGLLAWGEASGDQHAYTAGLQLLTSAWARFHDGAGWRATERPALPGMAASAAETGGALPTPSAVIMRLSLRSGHPGLVGKVGKALDQARAEVQEQPFWYAEIARLLQR